MSNMSQDSKKDKSGVPEMHGERCDIYEGSKLKYEKGFDRPIPSDLTTGSNMLDQKMEGKLNKDYTIEQRDKVNLGGKMNMDKDKTKWSESQDKNLRDKDMEMGKPGRMEEEINKDYSRGQKDRENMGERMNMDKDKTKWSDSQDKNLTGKDMKMGKLGRMEEEFNKDFSKDSSLGQRDKENLGERMNMDKDKTKWSESQDKNLTGKDMKMGKPGRMEEEFSKDSSLGQRDKENVGERMNMDKTKWSDSQDKNLTGKDMKMGKPEKMQGNVGDKKAEFGFQKSWESKLQKDVPNREKDNIGSCTK